MNQQQIGGAINCIPQHDPFKTLQPYITVAIEPLVKLEHAKNGWILTIKAKGMFVAETLENAMDVIKHHVGEPG